MVRCPLSVVRCQLSVVSCKVEPTDEPDARNEPAVDWENVPIEPTIAQLFEDCTRGFEDCTRGELAIFATFVQRSCAAPMYRDNSVRPHQPPGKDETR